MARVVVIGAGVGGLTAAAVLARRGLDVTVLEAQSYPGGCAGTFFHQGYRFEAGATLAGGFDEDGAMQLVAQAAGISEWQARPTETAMLVHLPDGSCIPRLAGENRWQEYRAAFGDESLNFFRWQEKTADALWQLALRLPPFPPQSPAELGKLTLNTLPWLLKHPLPSLALDSLRPLAAHLSGQSENLRLFVDGQLLISAQTTSQSANALYAAAALDLPRRGVVHLQGGMGTIAETLAQAVRQHGGRVLYRQEAVRIRMEHGCPCGVETKNGGTFPCELVLANLTPWNAAELLKEDMPSSLRRLSRRPISGWGAFVVYVGLDGASISPDFPLHHQIIVRRPLGEGNSVFASLSPAWDESRAPQGGRALTLSTHTALDGWWQLHEQDQAAYQARKAEMTEKLLAAAEIALPGLRSVVRLVLPGTPITFQRYTRRIKGWVGGFPQTSLFTSFPPRLAHNLWLVGDSIFPGQSTAAVALGGLRVAKTSSPAPSP